MRIAKYSNLFVQNFNKFYKFNYFKLLVTFLQKKGKKKYAFNVISEFFCLLKKNHKNLLNKKNLIVYNFLKKVFDYYCPKIGFIRKKVAARTYMLPCYIKFIKSRSIFLRWFIKCARERSEKTLSLKLLNEFNDIRNGVGRTIRKLEEYYQLATKNRPFLHFLRRRMPFGKKILKKYQL